VGKTKTASNNAATSRAGVKLLIDECLHLSLVDLAHAAGHIAYHVNHLGLGSSKDWNLISLVIEQDYTLVTNNRSDFLALYEKQVLHCGLLIIVPNVTPARQRELFRTALEHIGSRILINVVIEVAFIRNQIECVEYTFPVH
jgi:predicted nuclease of predicted toxin-antitoxin system